MTKFQNYDLFEWSGFLIRLLTRIPKFAGLVWAILVRL